MRLLRIIAVGSALAGLLSSPSLAAQTQDHFIGHWKLNVAQSKYTPGPGPRSLTVVFAKAGAGSYKVMVTGVDGDGAPINTSYTGTYDGKEAAVTGSPNYDAVLVTMMDPNTRHTIRKKAGKEVQTVHSVVSQDGKHYTSTTTGVNAKGEKISSTTVFDKQ